MAMDNQVEGITIPAQMLAARAPQAKIIALYAPLQFFAVDKKDVSNCTALSNNQLRISGTKNYAVRFILQKHIILRLLTDLEAIVLGLEPIVLDRSRVRNQPIY